MSGAKLAAVCDSGAHIQLNDPQQRDKEQVKGDEEAEGPPHVRDTFLLPKLVRLHVGWVDGAHAFAGRGPGINAAAVLALHGCQSYVWPHPLLTVSLEETHTGVSSYIAPLLQTWEETAYRTF